jgi:hypothetical protein
MPRIMPDPAASTRRTALDAPSRDPLADVTELLNRADQYRRSAAAGHGLMHSWTVEFPALVAPLQRKPEAGSGKGTLGPRREVSR